MCNHHSQLGATHSVGSSSSDGNGSSSGSVHHSREERCPANGVTMRGRDDGFGAQYAAMMSVFSWAKLAGKPFCVTPWTRMAHGANASSMFKLVGGHRYGPITTAQTASMQERHAELSRVLLNRTAWHPSLRENYHRTLPKPALRWFPKGTQHLAVTLV